jgi:hypothetical protein
MGPLQDDQYEGEHFEGRDFPSEAEWLQLGGPSPVDADAGDAAELEVSNDFVDRTLRALRACAAGAHANDGGAELPAGVLRAYAPPEPSIDFVARTVSALHADRIAHWRELLARYVAPEPSPQFVARTLSALTAGRRPGEPGGSDRAERREAGQWMKRTASGGRAWPRAWPLLAIAAATLLWFLPWTSPRAPLELRVSQREPAAFARSYAATPLPAVLATLSQAADPGALNDSGADGVWLLLGSKQ